jgi:hypothetical protein
MHGHINVKLTNTALTVLFVILIVSILFPFRSNVRKPTDKDKLKIQLHGQKQRSYLEVSVPSSELFAKSKCNDAKLGGRILRSETNRILYFHFLISGLLSAYK